MADIWLSNESFEYVDEKNFYECVRQYIISLLTFICLYFSSYLLINHLKKKSREEEYEDDFVCRVAVWLCCFTMAVSIGAVLLLPFSIFSNEILLYYPNSYYVIWLNESLIHALWNQIFLGTYIAMFLAMPFAWFFTESEGFSGSKKGIRARVHETFVVLLLLLVLASTLVWVFTAYFMNKEMSWISSLSEMWIPPLPLMYSFISLFGALVLLICTPLGFTKLFTVLGTYIIVPKFFVDLDDQIHALHLEENNIRRKLSSPINNLSNGNNGIYLQQNGEAYKKKSEIQDVIYERIKLEKERDSSMFEKNLLYPLCLIGLLAVTAVCLLMVALNCFKLVFGTESHPLMHKYPLGTISISKLGWFGILLQIFLIFYIMAASIVGFYSSPLFMHLTPKKNNTSMTKLILNCIILLVMSSALPVLSRTLGITSFNLMGEFGRLDWLGNFELVLFYNVLFEASTSFCIINKFTKSVRSALYVHFKHTALFRTSWMKTA
ncbi:limb region 1 protein homolog isoform X1 [Hydra vulgaris]|nr:limb region 1 protein homolog isoform X1 [Hydra vulgaris]